MSENVLTRAQVYVIIDHERDYQDKTWPQEEAPLSPSDALRLIKVYIAFADENWFATQDTTVKGVKVNLADLKALRRIAAIAVRAMEEFGVIPRDQERTPLRPLAPEK